MISAIFWNIIGVKAIHMMKSLITFNNIKFVVVFESFVSKDKNEGYKKFLGF